MDTFTYMMRERGNDKANQFDWPDISQPRSFNCLIITEEKVGNKCDPLAFFQYIKTFSFSVNYKEIIPQQKYSFIIILF
jgi:hypothetical protein